MRKLLLILVLLVGFANYGMAAETEKWQVQIKESALDGSKSALIALKPEADAKGFLGMKCENQEMMVVFSLGQHIGLGRMQMMEFSIDGGPVEKIGVSSGADGGSVTIDSGMSDSNMDSVLGAVFIKKLYGKKRLVIKLAPSQKAPTERIFDITGIQDIIAPAKNICSPLL